MNRRLLELVILSLVSSLLAVLVVTSDRPLMAATFAALTCGIIAVSRRFFS